MKKIYRNDIILNLIIIFVCIAVPIINSFTSFGQTKTVVISVDGQLIREVKVSENLSFAIEGMTVEIKDGAVFVSQSDCPDGLCMKMKDAKNVGDSIICVPNKVSVRIVGEKTKEGADVVAG